MFDLVDQLRINEKLFWNGYRTQWAADKREHRRLKDFYNRDLYDKHNIEQDSQRFKETVAKQMEEFRKSVRGER